jgi:SH3-like domain-containing protein
MQTTSMLPDGKLSARRCLRPALTLALAAGTLAVVALAPWPDTALAGPHRPDPSSVRQTNPPIIIPSPAPADGSGSVTPTQPNPTSGSGSVTPTQSNPTSGSGSVAPVQANPAATWRIADTNGVPARVRSAPSLAATVVMRLEPGTVVEPLSETASADGYQWRRISFGGATGWIATTLLLEPEVPQAPARPVVYVVAAVGELGLNLRESPSTASAVLASLHEGDVVDVVAGPREAEGREWLQVRTGSLTGWVIADAIIQR